MKKAIIPVAMIIFLVTFLFMGCAPTASDDADTQSEGTVTGIFDHTGFQYLDIQSAFDINITRADTYSIVIRAEKALYDYIDVTSVGSTLKIYLNPHHIFTDFTLGTRTLEVEITMPRLYGLTIAGASKGKVTDFTTTHNFIIEVSGASSLELKDIEVGDATVEVSGASSLSGNLTAGDTRIEVSGASSAELYGSADNIILQVSGASRADLGDFPMRFADANISGASEATLYVTGKLDTTLSGASRLYFLGNPVMGDINVSGASTVKHK